VSIDETGYILRPPKFGFEFERYWGLFSGKSRKKINREIHGLGTLEYMYEGWTPGDIEWMIDMNKANFGDNSYFDDPRFLEGFEKMLSVLSEMKRLHVSSVSVGGRLAAVDVGAVFNGRYTVLAGAADPEFPGIAKAINLSHIRWGCSNRFEQIDFLCGDFGWKERFHLEPRPLFTSTRNVFDSLKPVSTERKASCVPAC
jgi:CelD/BcsL family acetyltransferase involved in cellulose biosynthesis